MKLSLNGTQTICFFEQINLEHSLMYSLFSSQNLNATIDAEIKRIENDMENLDGAIKAMVKLDELVNLCRNSKNEIDLVESIMKKYELSYSQALYVSNLNLSDLNLDTFSTQVYYLDCCILFLKQICQGDL